MATVLILECDAPTLRQEGHSDPIDRLESLLRQLGDAAQLQVRRFPVNSAEAWDAAVEFGNLFRFDGVVVVAHGNPSGAAVVPGLGGMSWAEFADKLALVQPRVVLLASCFGGLATVATQFFTAIPSLRLFLGSPLPVGVADTWSGLFDFWHELMGLRMPGEASWAVSITNLVATGAVVFRRTREDWSGTLPAEWVMQDVAMLAAKVLRDELLPERRRRRRRGMDF